MPSWLALIGCLSVKGAFRYCLMVRGTATPRHPAPLRPRQERRGKGGAESNRALRVARDTRSNLVCQDQPYDMSCHISAGSGWPGAMVAIHDAIWPTGPACQCASGDDAYHGVE
jgi:hypothetical protein